MPRLLAGIDGFDVNHSSVVKVPTGPCRRPRLSKPNKKRPGSCQTARLPTTAPWSGTAICSAPA